MMTSTRTATTTASFPDAGLDWLVHRLGDRTGLDVTGSHRDRITDVVERMARADRAADYIAYANRLERDPEAFEALIDRITVGETYFFREPEHFRLLRDTSIGPTGPSPLRVWSAGCATGEEPYSVAITLDALGVLDRSQILGTDLSAHALQLARTAAYRSWSLRRCDELQRRAWFSAQGDQFVLHERYRRAVRWQRLNLLEGRPSGAFDVVLCRNVLIYLTPDGVAAATSALHDALVPGGVLLLGASDPVLEHPGLHRAAGPHGIAYHRTQPRRSAPQAALRSRADPLPLSDLVPSGKITRPPRAPDVTDPPRAGRAPGDTAGGPAAAIRRLGARGELEGASRMADAAITEEPLDAELRYLSAVVHLHASRPDEATRAGAAAIYLEPGLVVAHLVLAQAHCDAGRLQQARRSQRNALELLTAMPSDAEVALADGAQAGALAGVIVDEFPSHGAGWDR